MQLGGAPLEAVDTSLYGFAGEVVHPRGMVSLPLTLGTTPFRKTCLLKFLVVDISSAYNVILGRPTLNAFQAVISIYHMKIKFPMIGGVGEAQVDTLQTRKCYVEATKRGKKRRRKETPEIEDLNKQGKDPVPSPEPDKEASATVQPVEEHLTIELTPGDPRKVVKIGSKMTENVRNQDLNKACPIDFYPLTRIEQLVDSTSECKLLSMMDASQGYHQIMLAPEDHKRVSFITSDGTFCCVAMPFGLKDAGATYQMMVDKIFRPELGRNMEWRMFPRIHSNPMRHRGQPNKDQGYPGYGPPTNINEVQLLTGRMAALSRFISKFAEKGLPFFKTLRKVKNFEWIEECQQAFEELKAISSVLVREENGDQTPIYYISKVLNGAECRYPPIERMALALVTTATKLHPYFLSYPVRVRINTPLKQVQGRPEASGELALVDFVSEMTRNTQRRSPKENPGYSTWMDPLPHKGAEQA
ncbi:UNVERIFIED_CONTAM: Retrovirus-related Pol polyprotein from transposon [Sesamum angustifolium]|uniref:Retrovirus-related Pol polyprotein from transposon n=1 Tax=Sesamum angustifolium TaxID=2727405 RepID=A0AAW2NLW7_9LAMI